MEELITIKKTETVKASKFDGYSKVKLSEALKRQRDPGEIINLNGSIRAFCSECMGHQPELVKHCTCPECWLFPYRSGISPKRAKRLGWDVL